MSEEINKVLQAAVSAHQAGDLGLAEMFYRQVLASHPFQTDANHNLGILLAGKGESERALLHFKMALEMAPATTQYWVSYLKGLLQAGQVAVASRVLSDGKKQGLQGEMVDAIQQQLVHQEKTLRQRVQHPPKFVEKGIIEKLNRHDYVGMLAKAKEATVKFPYYPSAWYYSGYALRMLRRENESIVALNKAKELAPGDARYQIELSQAELAAGQKDLAELHARFAIQLAPENGKVYLGLGNVLLEKGKNQGAEGAYREALRLQPGQAEGLNGLGSVLMKQDKIEDAISIFRRAKEIDPKSQNAYRNLAVALKRSSCICEAGRVATEALKLFPTNAALMELSITALTEQGYFDEALNRAIKWLAVMPDVEVNKTLLFSVNYHPDWTAEQVYQQYQLFDERYARKLLPEKLEFGNALVSQRRLRIGYVSGDFKFHSTRHFIAPLLEHHDRTKVEVFAYDQGDVDDMCTRSYQQHVDHWVKIQSLDDEALASRIRSDEIDVLIDLSGHTYKSRLMVFARKPAPIQVSWMGFGYTTGLSAMDYFWGDEQYTPVGCEPYFSEQIFRLPMTAAFRPDEGMPEPDLLPYDDNGFITFGSLSRSIRVNYRVVRAWAAILKAVPDARLTIQSGSYKEEEMRTRLLTQFADLGIAAERLDVGSLSPSWKVCQQIDMSLDCFPHNSGTTLYESLFMGVPFVTLADRPSVGRIGASLLSHVGLEDLIAQDEEAYVQKAVALAQDVTRLRSLRGSLRDTMQASPLMDEPGFARAVEDSFQTMWQKWYLSQVEGEATSQH